ncbi:DUF6387 family protein [Providencia rettgeri]|uniref:DUF6387 family protein n=1 Tax=Providencia rettgeri TaxID=587 RepID=UPI001BA95870|nr:hypothetical protein [Providencia rettgeri]MBS0872606.1 hypothetical protein [Providencia rettgeri]MBS0919752.1 hypothetical protein [Providencia rettgeri]HEM7541685.1 hypothetical protein [Providencia rettgeri]HEM8175413.1 hypothetical protein [Providencia rettgeri]
MHLPRSKKEFEEQMEEIRLKLLESDSVLNKLRELSFGIKDIENVLDIRKYDEITKDFHPIQFYLAFKKRLDVFDMFFSVEMIREETYEEYISEYVVDEEIEGDAPSSRLAYEIEKNNRINIELHGVSKFLHDLIYGDAISIRSDDIKYGFGWESKLPIRIFDMSNVAFINRYCGFLGGMTNPEYNQIIFKAIEKDSSIEDVHALSSIPKGYGWPNEMYSSEKKIWAEIDLNTPDEILIDTFKNWIFEARKVYGSLVNVEVEEKIKSSIKTSTLKKWLSMRVLAYFDFKILCLFFDILPTFKNIGDVIFFDEYNVDTTEKARKTLVPMAEEILTDKYLDNLIQKITAETI